MMSHRHGDKRKKEDKKSPSQQRIGVEEAIRRLYNLEAAILCTVCDKKDCANRFVCPEYEPKEESD